MYTCMCVYMSKQASECIQITFAYIYIYVKSSVFLHTYRERIQHRLLVDRAFECCFHVRQKPASSNFGSKNEMRCSGLQGSAMVRFYLHSL